MYPRILACLALPFFLLACAQQGVIVEKQTSPQPFYQSVGVDGSYAFLLRDSAGAVHRQLVTPEVFERYAVGEFFNDLQPLPAVRGFDGKGMQPAAPPAVNPGPVMPKPIVKVSTKAKNKRVATTKKSGRKNVAVRKKTFRKKVSHRKVRHSRAKRIARLHHWPRIAKAR